MKTFFTSRQFDLSKALQKNFYLRLSMVILFLGSGFNSFALTKTWGGTTGITLNWTIGANWVGGIAPVAGDDIVFSTAGTLIFTTMPASVAYNSVTVNAGDVTISKAMPVATLTIGNTSSPGTYLKIASGASFTIGTFTGITLATATLTNAALADISGTLNVSSGVIYNTNNANVKTNVAATGIINNLGTINSSVSKLVFLANSNYEHQQNGGVIPLATWAISSTMKVTGIMATPTVLDQSFGNIIWNCPSQTVSQPTTATFTPLGNFTITNTGTSGDITVLATTTLNIPNLKTLSVTSGATLNVPSTAIISGAGTVTLSSGGNLKIGSVDGITSSGTTGNIQTTTRNFTTGANYIYNGISQNTGNGLPNVVNKLNLEGSGTKTFTNVTNVTNGLTINNGVVANLNSNNLTAGTLNLNTTLGGYNGTWGSTSSTATNKSALFFGTTGTATLNVSVNTCTGFTSANIIANNSPICSGNNVTFSLNGTADAIVTYSLNGGANTDIALNGSGLGTITVSGATITQTLNLVSVKNSITNCSTSLSGTSTVTVYYIPTITGQPVNQSIIYGANATFTVVATNNHATTATYQWEEKVGGTWTVLTNTGIYSGALSSSLTLAKPGVTLSDRLYRCIVSNPCGVATSNGLASLTVIARPITITADAKTKVYGITADPILTATVTTGTIVSGDVAGGALLRAWGETTGTYAISKNTYTYGSNYAETFVGTNLIITPASLTITADNKSKNYSDATPTLTVTYTGFVNGDLAPATLPTISTTAITSSPFGTYPITASGASDANYTISYGAGTLTVNKVPLTITATSISKCEGTTTNLTAFTSVGLLNGDIISSVTLSSTGAASTATKSSPGPSYPIVASAAMGTGLSNYIITYSPGTITITSPTLLFVPTPALCNGGLGGAELQASGGTPGISPASDYVFTSIPSSPNVTITGNIMNAPAGVYIITVTDNAGCTKNETLTISQPTVISGTSAITSNYNGVQLSCLGATDGKIIVTATGGTDAYEYSADNGTYQTSNVLMNLGAGTHTLKVKDANGCEVSLPISAAIIAPTAITATASKTNVVCFGGNTGTITLAGTGGTGAYAYTIAGTGANATGATTGNFTSLPAGMYNYSITDANNCNPATGSITIGQPTTIVVTATPTAALCFGGNGSATLFATGGNGTYTYTSTVGTITGNSLSTPAGIYTITATDGNSCTATVLVTIGQPSSTLSATISQVNVLCKGGVTGTATAVGIGGTSPYTYLWSNGQTTATATSLIAGSYTLIVTDANNCTFSPTAVIITEPTNVTRITTTGSSPVCEASALTLIATPTSSTGGLIYAWTGPNSFTANTQNASIAVTTLAEAGTYMITIKDANSCIATATTAVVINPLPTIYTVSGTGVICSGVASPIILSGSTVGINYNLTAIGYEGSILAGTGGVLTFTPPANILTTYTIEAINPVTGCKVSMIGSVTTANATNPMVTITAQTNVSCFGGNDGIVTAVASAGSGSYTYTFNGGITQPTGVFSGKIAGTYPIVATDMNTGCTGSVSTVIIQPVSLPSATVATSGIACIGNTVTLTATATGGTGTSYRYNWNGTGFVSTPTWAVTDTNTNTLVVKDVNGCTSTTVSSTMVTFNMPTPPAISGSTTLCSSTTLSLSTNVIGTYAWTGPNSFTSTSASISIANAQGVNAGTYTITVTDINSCVASATANVVINITPTVIVTPTTAILSCAIPSTIITASGATTYSWTGTEFTATTAIATINAVGTYVITGVANGCTATSSVVIGENKATPTISVIGARTLCSGSTINLTVAGGSTYLWSGTNSFTSTSAAVSIPNATVFNSGTYVVIVTNANGCSATAMATITVNSSVAVPSTQAFVNITTGGSITLTATGCSGTLLWFKSSNNSPTTMPVSPTTTTSYYAKCQVITDGVTCSSAKSTDIVVIVGAIISIKTGGAWEDPTTWDVGRVPLSTDEVLIDSNHNVIITTLHAVAKQLRYRNNGTLSFANPATQLTISGL